MRYAREVAPRDPIVMAAMLSAAAVGAAAAVYPMAGLAIVAGIALALSVINRQFVLLVVLLASIYIEIVTVGSVAISRLVAPIALLAIAIAFLQGDVALVRTRLWWWIGGYAVWAVASTLWTTSVAGTAFLLSSLAIALTYMLAFASFIRTADEVRRVLIALAVISLAVSAYALATFLAGETGRASGAKGDPNSFAAYLIIALPLVLVLASDTSQLWARRLFFGTAAVMVGAVMSSLSRGALLTLVVLVAAIAILPARRSLFRSRGQKVLVVGSVVVVAGLGFLLTASTFAPRLDSIFAADGGGSGRLYLWRAALHSAEERPILGLGFGAFRDASRELLLTTPGVDLTKFEPALEGNLSHSAYLGTLAELGIPGLLLFLGVLVFTALELRKVATIAHGVGATFLARTANALFVGLLAWSVSAAFLSLETARPLWILVGMTLALSLIVRRTASLESV